MPRNKVVYPSAEVPHLWAHQKVSEARNPQGNLYFRGDTIYSFGSHFPIARLVKFKGEQAVLFTTQGYSPITAQHKYAVADACTHMTVFHVRSVHGKHREVKAGFKEKIDELLREARKTRQGSGMLHKLDSITETINEATQYAEFFELKWEFKHPADWTELRKRAQELFARFTVLQAERIARKAEQDAKKAEMARLKFEELLPLWEDGKCPTSMLPDSTLIFLRTTHKGKRIETSRGAQVSMVFAKAVWSLIQAAREQGQAIIDISMEKLDEPATRSYPIDRIDADGSVRVGCHYIAWAQIKRFAKKLKWTHDDDPETAAATSAA